MNNLIKAGFLGGALGGALVDLIYISFAGPSGLFTLMGITDRTQVFLSHVLLGGILGTIFTLLVRRLIPLNIYLTGVIWGLVCLILIGGIPSTIAGFVNAKATVFGIIVWLVYGLVLAYTVKIYSANNVSHNSGQGR